MKNKKRKITKRDFITRRFGRSPRIKILEFLINNRGESWGVREIIQHAKVKHRNAVEELKDLVNLNMIYIEKTIGRSHLYKVNEDEPYIKSLIFVMDQRRKK
jgi:DNA-binding MarR family transcriptional regulator